QEVNITLWNKRTEFRADSNFKAWAFQVARFHVMAARRRLATESGKRVFAERLTDLLADECPYPEEKFDRKLTVLQSCLDQLRDKDRELLRIRYSDASSIDAYARREKRNPATLRATLRRLRETLLRCVNHKLAALPANGESA
ncbi:MAG TPA: sigma-70 family RNA polymerase sigma factor, partial [Luteolibacter sp.]